MSIGEEIYKFMPKFIEIENTLKDSEERIRELDEIGK